MTEALLSIPANLSLSECATIVEILIVALPRSPWPPHLAFLSCISGTLLRFLRSFVLSPDLFVDLSEGNVCYDVGRPVNFS
jgi:hypothetical protein